MYGASKSLTVLRETLKSHAKPTKIKDAIFSLCNIHIFGILCDVLEYLPNFTKEYHEVRELP